MTSALLAVYAVVVWSVHGEPNTVRWHEFEMDQHFFSRGVCEHYRPRLVAKWVADPDVPFHGPLRRMGTQSGQGGKDMSLYVWGHR